MRGHRTAFVDRQWATRSETTTLRQVDRDGRVALQLGPTPAPPMFRRKRGGGLDQRLHIGVTRRGKQRPGGGLFDDLTQIHHRDLVADMADDTQIVADEQIGQPGLALQTADQVQNLRLNRHIQCRDRLVKDDQFRLGRQGPR